MFDRDTTYCGDASGEWCNFAYKLKGKNLEFLKDRTNKLTSFRDNNPTVGDAIVAKPGSRVKTHCKISLPG